MTVQNTPNFVDYIGDDVTLVFNFTFRVDDVAWLSVDFTDNIDQFNLNLDQALNPGGNVTYLVAPPSPGMGGPDPSFRVTRAVPANQLLAYTRYDPFDSLAHENALDKLTMILQDQVTAIAVGDALVQAAIAANTLLITTGASPGHTHVVADITDLGFGFGTLQIVTDAGNTTTNNLHLSDAANLLFGTVAGGEFSMGFDGNQTLEIVDVSGLNTRVAIRGGINTLEINAEQNATSVIQIGESATLRGSGQQSILNLYGEDTGAIALAQMINFGNVLFLSSGPMRMQFDSAAGTNIEFNTDALKIAEVAVPPADEAGYGQVFVRNDSPNVLLFRDDTGQEFLLNSGPTPVVDQYNYQFSTSIAMFDPGAGFLRINNANPAIATQISISETTSDGTDIGASIFASLNVGATIKIVNPNDLSSYILYTLTSFFDGGGFQVEGISSQYGATIPADLTNVIVEISRDPYFDMTAVLGNGSVLSYNTVTDSFVESFVTLRSPSAGTAQIATGLSVLELNSASRVQCLQLFYASYLSNTDALIMGAEGGNYSIHTGIASNKFLDLYADNGGQPVRITNNSTLMIGETAGTHPDITGFGQFWVRNDAPNTPMFTDDAGNDFELNNIGSSPQTVSSTFGWANGSVSTRSVGSTNTVETGATFEFDDGATLDFGTGNDVQVQFDGANFLIAGTGNFSTNGFTDINLNARVVPQSLTTPASTTAALEAIANAINTSPQKVAGTIIFNATTNRTVWAVGSADGDLWVDDAGVTVHTPV